MPLLRLDNVSVSFGTHHLLDHESLTIKAGEKIGLLGRNGAGKSTLLKLIAGAIKPDSGERWLRPTVKIATLDQVLPDADEQTVYDVVAEGLQDVGVLLQEFHHLIQAGEHADLDALSRVQEQLEAKDGWSMQQRVDTVITQLQLPAEALMKSLSGGWRRRVALAKALVCEPDILLLDEPTNHLDIPAIEWLEQQLQAWKGALLVITHDRSFLQQVVNKIVELDRGHLSSWEGDYQGFLKMRAEQLASEERANELFDKKLADEEKWIRQGVKARRTRNEGRVRALKAMRNERSARREVQGGASFSIEQGDKSGKIVAELQNVTFAYGDKTIVKDFNFVLQRGDRIGFIGENGSGKSTVIKLLLGQLEATKGDVTLGTKLEIAYFDQLREHLNPEQNLIDNICQGREFIEINGKQKHAISYLGDFLFSPERTRTPVKALSGGEQNRAILAKIFSQSANLLVLDEPTNDLDVETLELLEELLLDFKGTLLLVSHDREFMDNVVTSVLVLEGNGKVNDFVGGYSDWVAKGNKLRSLADRKLDLAKAAKSVDAKPVQADNVVQKTVTKKKLSYKEQRELDALTTQIEMLEDKQMKLEALMATPDFYSKSHTETSEVIKSLEDTQAQWEVAFARWEALDS